jgi:uncharacterized protein YkwD
VAARARRWALAVVAITACVTPPAAGAPARDGARAGDGATALEQAVLGELNRVRRDPSAYAAVLEEMLPHFDGELLRRPGAGVTIRTREGAAAVREAVRALRATPPLSPLRYSMGLSRGARDHVRDQGARGQTGHSGSDASSASERVDRYGRWNGTLTENIAYGPPTAREVIVGLIVDDGVPDRGHRKNLLDPAVRVAGVACGEHSRYRVMCVIVHAAEYAEGREAQSR